MRRFARHLILLALAGIVMVGSGNGPGCILSPVSAEAAVTKKPAGKATQHQATRKKRNKGQVRASKKTPAKPTKATSLGPRKKVRATGGKTTCKRCEPQSLTYARLRSGNTSSRNGSDNGPMTWFTSEKKLGKTSAEPVAGSVLILDANRGHGMPTGHVMYVENVLPEGPSTYRIIFSHTNYDRRCSCETNIEALYNRSTMTLDIFSGAWKAWGRNLKVAGFIIT